MGETRPNRLPVSTLYDLSASPFSNLDSPPARLVWNCTCEWEPCPTSPNKGISVSHGCCGVGEIPLDPLLLATTPNSPFLPGTISEADCRRASGARAGFTAVLSTRNLQLPWYAGTGLTIGEWMFAFVPDFWFCPSPVPTDTPATTECPVFCEGDWGLVKHQQLVGGGAVLAVVVWV